MKSWRKAGIMRRPWKWRHPQCCWDLSSFPTNIFRKFHLPGWKKTTLLIWVACVSTPRQPSRKCISIRPVSAHRWRAHIIYRQLHWCCRIYTGSNKSVSLLLCNVLFIWPEVITFMSDPVIKPAALPSLRQPSAGLMWVILLSVFL